MYYCFLSNVWAVRPLSSISLYRNHILVTIPTSKPKTSLNQTLNKPKTCLNQTYFTAPSTKCLCNLNLCKPNTCLNWTNSSVSKGSLLDRFYCIIFITDILRGSVYSGFGLGRFSVYSEFGLHRFSIYSGFGLGRFLINQKPV
jgi:hypothetical protein